MTEMSGLGVIQCRNCYYCMELYHVISYCYNVNSKHYGHVITDFHPICNEFIRKGSDGK